MRWLFPVAAALALASAPAGAIETWHGPGYYVVGCSGETCSILGGPFATETACKKEIDKGLQKGPDADQLDYACRDLKTPPDGKQFYDPWKG